MLMRQNLLGRHIHLMNCNSDYLARETWGEDKATLCMGVGHLKASLAPHAHTESSFVPSLAKWAKLRAHLSNVTAQQPFFSSLIKRKLKPWMQMISWPDKLNNLIKRRESCRQDSRLRRRR